MLLLLSSGALADNFVGRASVIDGDTLEIHGTHIRLSAIAGDAPDRSLYGLSSALNRLQEVAPRLAQTKQFQSLATQATPY
jgi:endonuclease YncB( thermonuclease family)